MKFKREDMGLYIATSLIGGGIGLLAGAFLTAIINKKRERQFEGTYEEMAWNEDVYYPIQTGGPIDEETIIDDAEVEVLTSKKGKVVNIVNVVNEADIVVPEKRAPSHRLSKEDRMELNRLTREYVVGSLQIELVEKGTMSVEELEEALIDADFDQTVEDEEEDDLDIEIFDYSKKYRLDDKPDMADLLADKQVDDEGPRQLEDLLVTVNGEWEILLDPPIGKRLNQKRTIYFDPEDEGVYTQGKGGDMVAADLRVIASPEVRDIIMPWLLFETEIESIYLNDIRSNKTRWYEIVRLKEDDEDADY